MTMKLGMTHIDKGEPTTEIKIGSESFTVPLSLVHNLAFAVRDDDDEDTRFAGLMLNEALNREEERLKKGEPADGPTFLERTHVSEDDATGITTDKPTIICSACGNIFENKYFKAVEGLELECPACKTGLRCVASAIRWTWAKKEIP